MISVQKIKFSDLRKENREIKAQLSRILNENWIALQGGAYSYNKCEKIFMVTKAMNAQRLSLRRNYKPTILAQIRNIFFQNLSNLNVAQNHIVSLQPLIFLQAPNLKSLDLSENKISSLKILRKLPFVLSGLQIHGNPILQLKYIEQIKFEKTAKYLILDEYTDIQIRFKTAPTSLEGMVDLVKIQPMMLKEITFKKRINQSLIQQFLKSKYKSQNKTIEILSPLF